MDFVNAANVQADSSETARELGRRTMSTRLAALRIP